MRAFVLSLCVLILPMVPISPCSLKTSFGKSTLNIEDRENLPKTQQLNKREREKLVYSLNHIAVKY